MVAMCGYDKLQSVAIYIFVKGKMQIHFCQMSIDLSGPSRWQVNADPSLCDILASKSCQSSMLVHSIYD